MKAFHIELEKVEKCFDCSELPIIIYGIGSKWEIFCVNCEYSDVYGYSALPDAVDRWNEQEKKKAGG